MQLCVPGSPVLGGTQMGCGMPRLEVSQLLTGMTLRCGLPWTAAASCSALFY